MYLITCITKHKEVSTSQHICNKDINKHMQTIVLTTVKKDIGVAICAVYPYYNLLYIISTLWKWFLVS